MARNFAEIAFTPGGLHVMLFDMDGRAKPGGTTMLSWPEALCERLAEGGGRDPHRGGPLAVLVDSLRRIDSLALSPADSDGNLVTRLWAIGISAAVVGGFMLFWI